MKIAIANILADREAKDATRGCSRVHIFRWLSDHDSQFQFEIGFVFWKGDLDGLRGHVDSHVQEAFAAAVEQRTKDGLTLDNRLVAIDQAVISEATLERGVAVITVKPGFVDTGMTWGLLKPGSPLVASPQRVATDILRAIARRRDVVYTPWFWRWSTPGTKAG